MPSNDYTNICFFFNWIISRELNRRLRRDILDDGCLDIRIIRRRLRTSSLGAHMCLSAFALSVNGYGVQGWTTCPPAKDDDAAAEMQRAEGYRGAESVRKDVPRLLRPYLILAARCFFLVKRYKSHNGCSF